MTAAKIKEPITIARINASTLESEVLSASHPNSQKGAPINIYAIIGLMEKSSRRSFIHALNNNCCYECCAEASSFCLSISLLSTGGLGCGWSHVLILRELGKGILPA